MFEKLLVNPEGMVIFCIKQVHKIRKDNAEHNGYLGTSFFSYLWFSFIIFHNK